MASQAWALLCLCLQLLALSAAGEPYTKLQDIHTDQGTWDHAFDPQRFTYNVLLAPTSMSVSLAAKIEVSQYASAKMWPTIRFNDTQVDYGASQGATRIYTLAATPYPLQLFIDITVTQPINKVLSLGTPSQTVYHLIVSRPPDFQRLLTLTQLKVTDKWGQALATQPAFIAALPPSSKYTVYVAPNTRQVNLTVACDPQASTFIGDDAAVASVPTVLPMDFRSTHTVARVSCSYLKHRAAFTIDFLERVQIDNVKMTLHVLGDAGFVRQTSPVNFVVFGKQSSVVVIPMYNDTRVGLDLLQKNGQRFRLGVGIPTPRLDVPTNGTNAMDLVLYNRAHTRHFGLLVRRYVSPDKTTVAPLQRIPNGRAVSCGYIVAAVVAACLIMLGLVRGVCEAFGLGTPRFASPALRSLTLLLQFVALNSVLVEPCVLTDFARPLRWLAVFPPPDMLWQFFVGGSDTWQVRDDSIGSTEAAISLACSSTMVGVLFVLHVLALARLLLGGCLSQRYTLPHRLSLGGWEARCLLLLAYPISCASVVLLLRAQQSPPSIGSAIMWILGALCAMTILSTLTLAAECAVSHALKGRLVTWVFEGGRVSGEDDIEHDETGYFCDATCDQLGTVPAERSSCSAFISHRWGTTVADIQPIELEQTLTERAATTRLLAAKDDLEDVAAEADGTAEVEVVATLRPGALCQPFYCEVGRCTNVPWLRAQLDAPALLRLHQEVDSKLNAFATPVRVHVSQLQGPVTSGWLSFCFDGLHWPHLPPLELAARIFLGALTAVAIALPSYRAPALFAASFLAGTLFIFIFFHTPCVTIMENALLLMAYLGLALVAFELSAYAAGAFSLQVCSWAITTSVGLVIVPLLAYAILASLSLFVAASCPRVSEEELESHRANNVDLSLRGPQDSWLLLVPATCTVPVTDAFVHTREEPGGNTHIFVTENVGKGRGAHPRLEFPVLDYLAPTEKLEVPRVVLFGPSQARLSGRSEDLRSYQSETIYGDEDPKQLLAEFLRRSALPAEHAPGITKEVLELLRKRARPNHILVVDLMEPPRARQLDADDEADADGYMSGGSEEERETLVGTSRTNTNRARDFRKVDMQDDY